MAVKRSIFQREQQHHRPFFHVCAFLACSKGYHEQLLLELGVDNKSVLRQCLFSYKHLQSAQNVYTPLATFQRFKSTGPTLEQTCHKIASVLNAALHERQFQNISS